MDFASRDFSWRSFIAADALVTTKRVEIVDAKWFSRDELDPELNSYVLWSMHQPELEAVEVRDLKKAVITTEYVDFPDAFSDEKANKHSPDSTEDRSTLVSC